MNFILFGPPGVGKSTLIGTLKTLKQSAIDLEDFYPNKIRFQIPNYVDNTFIGAADLDPKRSYRNAKKILLFMPQADYDARRAARDSAQPGKGAQAKHNIDDWRKGVSYDKEIDVTGTPDSVASSLIKYLREVGK